MKQLHKDSKRKLGDNEKVIHTLPTREEGEQSSEQPVTVRPTLFVGWVEDKNPSTIHMEYQMTIQAKIERLNRKQASMLLMVLNCRAVINGIDITLYLAMEYLFTLLVKSGHKPEEVRDEKERRTVMIAELILTYIRGEWQDFLTRELLPHDVVESIVSTGWLPGKRVLKSWENYWRPERFLKVRIVPLELLIERDGNSSPYSSYTKGYGQDGHRSRTLRTPYSAELDGIANDPEPPSIPLEDLDQFVSILNATLSAKSRKPKK
jgi:hypothetical protein